MIDIHSHILPATDDGAQSLEDSLAIGRQESEGGTTVVFATPHIYNVADLQKGPVFLQSVASLQAEFDKEGVGIILASGAEVSPMMEVLDALDSKLPITLANKSKHLLLDLPLGQWPMYMDRLTFDLLALGITPILAHPERTMPVQESIEVLIPFLERGVLCQVNAGSLTGKYGPFAKKRANQILTRQWCQFLASDIHRPSPKGPLLRGAMNLLSALPPKFLQDITVNNPGHVLAGTSVPSINYEILDARPERTGFLSGLFKKRK